MNIVVVFVNSSFSYPKLVIPVPVRDNDQSEEHSKDHGSEKYEEEELVQGRRDEVPLQLEVTWFVRALRDITAFVRETLPA